MAELQTDIWRRVQRIAGFSCSSAANAGLLCTAKGTASLLVPRSSVLAAATGNGNAVFVVAAAMNIAAALIGWLILRPMRRAVIQSSVPPEAVPAAQPA